MSEKKQAYHADGDNDATADGVIDSFRGENAFLSNFFPAPVEVEGIVYPTGEHAFQAMKARETSARYEVQQAPTPAAAKARGRKVALREDWDTARFDAMEQVIRAKFADPELRRRLLATGDTSLIEGNTWRDTTWGAIKSKDGVWKGRNELGKMLMRIRDELRSGQDVQQASPEAGWKAGLLSAARTARENAYVPYSKYKVGAAILTASGDVFAGCNVENASYGLCNCAERTAVFTAIAATGAPVVRAVAVVTEEGGTPCGACRQVLAEFTPRDGTPMEILLVNGEGDIVQETTLDALFPSAFSLR